MISQKTVVIVTSFALPHLGGVERYAHQLAKQFVRNGTHMVVVCLNTEKISDHEVVEGIEYFRLPCFLALKGRFPVPFFNRKWFQLVRQIKTIPFSNVVINVRFYLLSLIAAMAAKRQNLPALLIEHGTSHFALGNPILSAVAAGYEHFITRLLKHKIQEFYGVSQACNTWLAHFNITPSGVIYNGVDPDDIPPTNVNFHQKLNLPDEAVVITYIGRLVAEKGVLNLIAAFQHLAQPQKQVNLIIAGSGPLEKEIPETGAIRFLGNISHAEVFQLLAETDILVLPSAFPEGLPTILLEAGLMGCAIIATPMGGTREVITSGELGLIIPDNAVATLQEAMQRLMDDPGLRAKMGENITARVRENFSWDVIFKHFTESITDPSLTR